MILSLTVTNWMSFKDETRWLLVASQERTHRNRLPKKGRLAINPIAAIFGPNGSGKTNLIEAIKLIQMMVLDSGTTTDSVIPYAFGSTNEPTTIELEMLINERVYAYTVSMTTERIIKEELSEISSKKPICLYSREVTSDLNQKYQFPDLKCDERIKKFNLIGNKTKTNKLFLNVCGDKSATNTLFFNRTIGEVICDYDDVVDWFKMIYVKSSINSLQRVISSSCLPDELKVLQDNRSYIQYVINDPTISEEFNPTISQEFNDWLWKLDTGIIRLDIGTTKSGRKELVAIYRDNAGGEVPLSAELLSSGTIELLRFLVLLMQWKHEKIVLVIDELGQNFHNDLFKALIELCLSHCGPETRSQLIFTTHNQSVMTQSLLRLDEMWVFEKHGTQSTLHSFVEFKGLSARTDVAQRYRHGHLGGVPNI